MCIFDLVVHGSTLFFYFIQNKVLNKSKHETKPITCYWMNCESGDLHWTSDYITLLTTLVQLDLPSAVTVSPFMTKQNVWSSSPHKDTFHPLLYVRWHCVKIYLDESHNAQAPSTLCKSVVVVFFSSSFCNSSSFKQKPTLTLPVSYFRVFGQPFRHYAKFT